MKINAISQWRQYVAKFFDVHLHSVDRYHYGLMALMIAILLYWCISVLERPISTQQQAEIRTYSSQDLYPHAREFAMDLLIQEQSIKQFQYFKFLRVLDHEQKRIRYQKDEQ